MITAEQYAASIVEKYHVVPDTGSLPHRAADDVIPVLKEWGKQYLLGITLSGAYVKNTAVSLSSHVDVLIEVSPVPGMEMKKIFWNLFEHLTDRGLRPHTRNVSIQVQRNGLSVDLIPAYRDRESSGSVLFNKKSGAAVHTDIARHIHLVSNSGRQQEICALKIWRERNSLDFPSLYLELTVLRALETERFGQIADNVLSVMRYLSNKFERIIVRDPGNQDNIVSGDLNEAGKKAIVGAARTAVNAIDDDNWKKVLW